MRIVLAMEAREGPNTQDKAERLMAATGHLFEDMMATYHPPGIAGKVAGKSPNTQWAFRQLWKQYGVELFQRDSQQCVHDGRRCGHIGILSSSVLSLSSSSVRPKSVRVVSGRRFEELEHGATPRLARVTADGTVMFELWRAS